MIVGFVCKPDGNGGLWRMHLHDDGRAELLHRAALRTPSRTLVGRVDLYDARPPGTCGCGADLADGTDLGVTRSHQQHEVPQMSATCTQHDLYAVRCGRGRVHTAERPEDVADTPVSHGPNLQTWCVFRMVIHAIPVQRCAELVATLTGVARSVGWVHGLPPGQCLPAGSLRHVITPNTASWSTRRWSGAEQTTADQDGKASRRVS